MRVKAPLTGFYIMAKELADFRQGDTKKIKIAYGDGLDITGYKHWFTLREELDSVVIIAQTSSVVGDHPDDEPLNGNAWLELGSDVSKLIQPNKYVWDVQRVIPNTNPPDVLTLAPTLKNANDKVEVKLGVTIVDV